MIDVSVQLALSRAVTAATSAPLGISRRTQHDGDRRRVLDRHCEVAEGCAIGKTDIELRKPHLCQRGDGLEHAIGCLMRFRRLVLAFDLARVGHTRHEDELPALWDLARDVRQNAIDEERERAPEPAGPNRREGLYHGADPTEDIRHRIEGVDDHAVRPDAVLRNTGDAVDLDRVLWRKTKRIRIDLLSLCELLARKRGQL